jgi:thymidylate synthase
VDLPTKSGEPSNKDVPCNITSILKVRDQRLEWLQIMRSNDLFLGLPHNLAQFLTLQEILSGWIGIDTGSYTHVSDSLHVYESDMANIGKARRVEPASDPESLRFPYDESMRAFQDLYERCSEVGSRAPGAGEVSGVVLGYQGPSVFRNWMFILGAEASRRHGWLDLATDLAHRCTNAALLQLWEAWLLRVARSKAIAD